jgi:DNA (cytosine-5)-methyltransferase 3A
MKVLSLFDGMACGMLAMLGAGIKVDRYIAFEIDKYAVQTSSHNFPMIEHKGDVFNADFTEFQGFDFLVGGSPCTYWSIAQQNNRETVASGMGWELFCQFVRALHEAQPLYFIYENNKSMSSAIRESITEAFGFEPICINSALVSAQNRQRLYWVGKREQDGTYSCVRVQQPEDRSVLLCDILGGNGALAVNATCDGKARTIRATCYKDGIRNMVGNEVDRKTCVAEPVNGTDTKAISNADGKTHPVYEVKGGQITINGKQYSIELEDGFYIFRKLTVGECKILQTVPEWYRFPVSDTQAYKMLGNGWTVDVIAHLINATQAVGSKWGECG